MGSSRKSSGELLEMGGNAWASRAENLASTRGRRGSRLFSYCRIGTRRHPSRASFGMRAKRWDWRGDCGYDDQFPLRGKLLGWQGRLSRKRGRWGIPRSGRFDGLR